MRRVDLAGTGSRPSDAPTHLPGEDGDPVTAAALDAALKDAALDDAPGSTQLPRQCAIVVYTPDAVISGQVMRGIRLLETAEFDPVAAARCRITPDVCRRLWPQGIHQLSVERYAVCELMLGFADSIALLLSDQQLDDGRRVDGGRRVSGSGGRTELAAAQELRSATHRLSALKGAGEPSGRRSGTLRADLYAPNAVFRLVHTPDSPADLARELDVLLDAQSRRRLLAAGRHRTLPETVLPGTAGVATATVDTALAELATRAVEDIGESMAEAGPWRLDVPEQVRKSSVWKGATSRCRWDAIYRRRLLRLLDDAARGGSDRTHLVRSLGPGVATLRGWDLVVLAVELVCDAERTRGRRSSDGPFRR